MSAQPYNNQHTKHTMIRSKVLKAFQHGLSQWVGWLCQWQRPRALVRYAIRIFIGCYSVKMHEAQEPDYRHYISFGEFFIRPLEKRVRPIHKERGVIVSPVDGKVSQSGSLYHNQLVQAKGRHYTLLSLLGGYEALAAVFHEGAFLTAYLSPADYHRVHMPCPGRLLQMIYIPGHLFPTHPRAVNQVDSLFARNERVICLFETEYGKICVIMVGAMLVGSIWTVWEASSIASLAKTSMIQTWDYSHQSVHFDVGQEIGHFMMGSTVILLFPHHTVQWDSRFQQVEAVQLGQPIGRFCASSEVTSS